MNKINKKNSRRKEDAVRPIVLEDFENYYIDKNGTVFKRKPNGVYYEIARCKDKDGRFYAKLCGREYKRAYKYLHRLLAMAFGLIAWEDENKYDVYFKDGDKYNISLDNLGIRERKVKVKES